MGSKQTKLQVGDCYLPATPPPQLKLNKPHALGACLMTDEDLQMDPRSPSGTRTPIHLFPATQQLQQQRRETVLQVAEDPTSRPLGLRKRFLKGFTYSLNDPRSPSVDLNRTPLIFEGEKPLNLDDTFSDLFVESRLTVREVEPVKISVPTATQQHVAEVVVEPEPEIDAVEEMPLDAAFTTAPQILADEVDEDEDAFYGCSSPHNTSPVFCSLIGVEEGESETMPSGALLQQTPPLASFQPQKPLDPRSPTYGVVRTPIIFSDDDTEAAEDILLENVLATLSLQLNASNTSSDLSFATPGDEPLFEKGDLVQGEREERMHSVTNKPLERVRIGAARKPARNRHAHRPRIYEDRENATATVATATPSVSMTPPRQKQLASNSPGKRTPLSCVKNRSHMGARNEAAAKLKSRPMLSALDEGAIKRANLRTMQGDGETPEMLELL